MRNTATFSSIFSIVLVALASCAISPAQAARNLITQPVVASDLVPLRGQVSPVARGAKDLGPVGNNMSAQHLILLLNRPIERQQALDALVDQLHDRKSPLYHQWLTPAQFGQQFGASDDDVNTLVDWLQSQGFKIDDVVPGRTHIIFSGSVAQVKQAFHTQIHTILVNGEQRHANLTDPQIPAALAPLVKGFRQLSDFRAKPLKREAGVFQRDRTTGVLTQVSGPQTVPEITFGGNGRTFYSVTPQDFYTIYNMNPLLQAGINGAGVTIAVIEETNVTYTTDVDSFRSQFGLPPYPTTANSTQGGINWMIGPGNGCSTVGVTSTDEEAEALLDVEWAGAVAPNATIDFVACATSGDGIGSYGTDLAASYIANYLASTVSATSLSYGQCELSTDSVGASFYSNLWQQMNAEGITPVVASGDAGSTGCDQNNSYAVNNPSVNVMASTPYNISAGGTDFSDAYQTVTYTTASNVWWSNNDVAPYGSALSYVPEISWGGYCANPLFASYLQKINFTTFGTNYTPIAICNNQYAAPYLQPIGGGGGISTFSTLPTWQSVYGVGLANSSTNQRNQPDVALFASAGWWNHTLLYCQSDTGVTCDYSNANDAYALGAGGTSFVAPQLNGLMALIVQQTGARQGNANYTLYGLAAQEYGTQGNPNTANLANCSGSAQGANVGSNCVFRDVANDTPSLQGGTITSDIVQACLWSSVPNCWRNRTNQQYGLSSLGNHPTTENAAYQTAAGYDLATGLGSLNITNLVNNWNTLAQGFATTTALAVNPTTLTAIDNTTLSATVSEIGRGSQAPPSGIVDFYLGSVNGTLLGTAPLVPAVTPTNQANGTLVVQGSALVIGTNSVIAYFPGDGANDAPSTSTAVTVTVNQASQTITFPSIGNQQYGVAPITLNASTTSGLTVTYTVISGPATVVGNVVTISGAGMVTIEADQAGNAEYLAAPPVQQSFNVTPALLTVTATALTMTYGDTYPNLTYGITGFVNGDNQSNATTGAPTLSTTAPHPPPVGVYPITVAQGTLAAQNYTFDFVSATLTVVPKVLIVAAQSLTTIYGSGQPTLTYTMTGFVNGDSQATATTGSPALATTAPSNPPVGTYAITISQGALAAANYTFQFVNASLTVSKAILTVTANNFTISYHQAIPTLTYTMTGFKYSDTQASATTGTPILFTWANTQSSVGTYVISASVGSLAAANYKLVTVAGTLTIVKAVPVVSWHPTTNTIRVGTALGPGILDATVAGNITGSFKYTTYVNGVLTTVNTSTVLPVGTYTITVTFSPTDSTDYWTATAQQVITVTS